MNRTLTLELPEEIYEQLSEAAPQLGLTPEETAVHWLRQYAPKRSPSPMTEGEGKAAWARLLRHAGAIHSNDVNAGDNDQIDKDLAREYGLRP